MVKKKKLSKGLKRHLRKEKSRIRREFLDIKKQKELINELYLFKKPVAQDGSKKSEVDNKKINKKKSDNKKVDNKKADDKKVDDKKK